MKPGPKGQGKFPARDAEVMRLRESGLSISQVAKLMGMTVPAATMAYSRACDRREYQEQCRLSILLRRWSRYATR